MAKLGGSDNSGISMVALVLQVLIDGKVHTLKQISEHMLKYMFKGMSPERVQDTVKLMLDHNSRIEKTPKGYKLKSGSNLTDVVREVLAEAHLPISEKEITKLVAKKQKVPPDMILLELEEDEKIAVASYSSRKFYYLADRKEVNEKVYKILKNRNRAMTVEEIYETLEAEEGIPQRDCIFLPREDKRFSKISNKYTIKKKEKPKSKPAELRHLVNREEMEKVVRFLDQSGNRMTAQELAEEVLSMQLDQTNLRFKLARDHRIKREDNRFYYEVVEVDKEVPVKVKEKIGKDFFKVKARMMGSTEVHTVADLLDRVYGVNIATQDYYFYLQELADHLMQDDETVLLLDNGWTHQTNEPRTIWMPSKEFQPVLLPSPPSPLQPEKLTAAERLFLDEKTTLQSIADKNETAIRVTALDRKYGYARFSGTDAPCFSKHPLAYEIVLDVEEENESYESFVLVREHLVRGLEVLYSDRLPPEGGFIVFTPNPDNSFRFSVRLEKATEPYVLTMDRLNLLSGLNDRDWVLPELVRELFRTSKERFLSCHQIWAEANLVRRTTREDILATLRDYNCFLPIQSMDGYYSHDSSAGLQRLSARMEAEKRPVHTIPEPEASRVGTETPVSVTEKPGVRVEPAAEEHDHTPVKEKTKQKAKKEVVRKRRKETDSVPEELPDHLLKLKGFERKLPKLKTAVRDPQGTAPAVKSPERPARIGAVSTGRSIRSKFKTPIRTGTDEAPVLVEIPPMPKEPMQWETTAFVNPQRGKGYAELQMTLEVLKAFVSRIPEVRRTDGSIVLFLDNNDIAVYFRIPPENQECWLAWIPEKSLETIENQDIWLKTDGNRAKKSDNGYWWATDKFRGPKGNYRDRNVLPGVEIVGKLLELMEQAKR